MGYRRVLEVSSVGWNNAYFLSTNILIVSGSQMLPDILPLMMPTNGSSLHIRVQQTGGIGLTMSSLDGTKPKFVAHLLIARFTVAFLKIGTIQGLL